MDVSSNGQQGFSALDSGGSRRFVKRRLGRTGNRAVSRAAWLLLASPWHSVGRRRLRFVVSMDSIALDFVRGAPNLPLVHGHPRSVTDAALMISNLN